MLDYKVINNVNAMHLCKINIHLIRVGAGTFLVLCGI